MKKFYEKIVRRVFLFLLLFYLSLAGMATNYYVSNSGSDSNSGLTTALPWLTLSKVSGKTFLPGDSILLKRGGIWRETLSVTSSGNSIHKIIISNYGAGSKPRILGSQQPTSWTDQGGNVWKSDASFLTNPYTNGASGGGNIWSVSSDQSVNTGIYKTSLGDLIADNMWYYGSNSIYLYSTSNPATRYSAIEVEVRATGIALNHKQYIEINGIDILYVQTCIHEGYIAQGGNGLIVRNCELAYTGYPDGNSAGIHFCYNNSLIENNVIHDHGRRGISLVNVNSSLTIRNVTIRNNTFSHGYHTTSVDVQLTGGYTGSIDSVFIYGNTIADDVARVSPAYPMQMFISDQSAPGTLTHIYVYNNAFTGTTGAAMNIGGAEDVKVWNNTFYGFNTVTTADRQFLFIGSSNVDVKNNIFHSQLTPNTDYKGIIMLTSGSVVTSDYNCIYRTSAASKIYHAIGYGDYTSADSTSIRSALGWDVHSKFRDPLVVSSSDLHLQSTSPCIKAGVYLGIPPNMGANPATVNKSAEIPSISLFGQAVSLDKQEVINIVSDNQTIKVYPNPNQGRFTLRFSSLPVEGSHIEVFDLSGRKVVSRLITANTEEFDLSGRAAGLYILKMILGSEEKIQKIVIQN